jgi:hypothetical protein
MLGSSIPSAKLEQEAQIFGFLESPCSAWAMSSPQQMQMVGFIARNYTLKESRTTRRTMKSSNLRHGLEAIARHIGLQPSLQFYLTTE